MALNFKSPDKSLEPVFNKIRQDMDERVNEIEELRQLVKEQAEEIRELREEFKAYKEEGKGQIDTNEIVSKIQKGVVEALQDSKQETQREENNLKKEMLQKFEKNKKDIIKNKIQYAIENKNMTLPELKEFIVDQNQYCSKASFYRYFTELKNQQQIGEIYTGQKKILTVMTNR